MRARSFFYVCAGLMMLAVAYHLGTLNAFAQQTALEAVEISGAQVTGVIGRQFFSTPFSAPSLPIPGTSRAMATSAGEGTSPYKVVLENGEIWTWVTFDISRGAIEEWQLTGQLIGGPISVKPSTMSEVKGKYRKEN